MLSASLTRKISFVGTGVTFSGFQYRLLYDLLDLLAIRSFHLIPDIFQRLKGDVLVLLKLLESLHVYQGRQGLPGSFDNIGISANGDLV